MTRRPLVRLALSLLLVTGAAVALAVGSHALPTGAAPGGPVAQIRLGERSGTGTAGDLSAHVLALEARMGTALVADLALDVDGDPSTAGYRAGDVAYWASAEEVVVFLTDGAAVPAEGLVRLGRVTDDLDRLTACADGCVVRFVEARTSTEPAGDLRGPRAPAPS